MGLKRADAEPFAAHEQAAADRIVASAVDGRHYSSFADEVKALRRAGEDDAAAGLLLRLIDAVEREARIPMAGHTEVPRWYFDQLAIIYAKAGKRAERGRLLQRYVLLQADAERDGALLLRQLRTTATTPRRPNQVLKSFSFSVGRLLARMLRRR